jgi:SH3 domain-containing YSC84-like protein 1
VKRLVLTVVLCFALGGFALARPSEQEDRKKTEERLQSAAEVLKEVMAAPDKGIPDDLLKKAHCAVIVPGVKKGAFLVGAQYGKGFATCRKNGGWSAPAAIRVEGGSFGFQIGGEEIDVIMLVMNSRGAEKLMTSKFTLGGDASVAAGPVGRTTTAQTDALMNAEILTWSRSRGVFGGIALTGATLRPDEDDNRALYGEKLGTKEIVDSNRRPPAAAAALLGLLKSYSPVEEGRLFVAPKERESEQVCASARVAQAPNAIRMVA